MNEWSNLASLAQNSKNDPNLLFRHIILSSLTFKLHLPLHLLPCCTYVPYAPPISRRRRLASLLAPLSKLPAKFTCPGDTLVPYSAYPLLTIRTTLSNRFLLLAKMNDTSLCEQAKRFQSLIDCKHVCAYMIDHSTRQLVQLVLAGQAAQASASTPALVTKAYDPTNKALQADLQAFARWIFFLLNKLSPTLLSASTLKQIDTSLLVQTRAFNKRLDTVDTQLSDL
jgi:hypothetical protein